MAIEEYKSHVNPYLGQLLEFVGYDSYEVEAKGLEVRTEDGRVFLDFVGGFGSLNFGHAHPEIVDAVKNQLEKMCLSSKILPSAEQSYLARDLAEFLGHGIEYFFFCNSGAEANEAAFKFARLATGKKRILYARNSFHGKTLGALSATGRDHFRKPFLPLLSWFEEFEFGNLEDLKSKLDDDVAAVVLEPVQGEGGVVIPPEDFLPGVRRLTEEVGALLILDEVQTGFGRLGWPMGFFEANVSPDIVTMAKSLGGGVCPIGAVGMTKKVVEGFEENPLIHSSTFGGNPLACAAARAALSVLKREKLWERAKKWEKPVGEFLRGIQKEYSDLIVDVRGKGLLWGIEFETSDVGELAVTFLAERGVLLAFALNSPKVLRFEPPLIMEESHFSSFKEAFSEALSKTRSLLEAL